jgi:hypothetical protein
MLRALLLAALLVGAAGCATSRQAPPAPQPAAEPKTPAWQVPAESYGTQILYRANIAGAEGEGSLKLTLRLASPERYQAEAVDPLGRVVWGLDVEGDRGLWLDHRGHTYCRLDGPLDLAFLPLGPLSLAALPALLLGRLPAPPADPASAVPAGAGGALTLSYRDAAGRRWSAALREGQAVSWGVWQDEAASPILSWVSSGGWAILSDRRKGVQVRWREVLREPLRRVAPMSPPGEYREAPCTRSP